MAQETPKLGFPNHSQNKFFGLAMSRIVANKAIHDAIHLTLLNMAGPDAVPDDQLLERFHSQGEEIAFTALVKRHGPMVLRVCERVLGKTPDAEDAFQATFIVLVRKAGKISRPNLLANWLYGVAYRIALKARACAKKHHSRERPISQGATVPEPALNERSTESSSLDLRGLLDEAVNRLPEKYRLPVVLCYLEGRTTEAASQTLGCPQGTVMSRLSRARDLLRDRLARRGLALY